MRLSYVDKNMPRQRYVLPMVTKQETCCTDPIYFGFNYLHVYRFAAIKTFLMLIQPYTIFNSAEQNKLLTSDAAHEAFEN